MGDAPRFEEVSPWVEGPADRCEPLDTDLRADVVVIGAGYTGLSSAIALRAEGADVVVLEQDFLFLSPGEMLASRIQGRAHSSEAALTRRGFDWPPEPLRWIAAKLVNAGLSALDARTDRQIRKLRG